MLDALLSCNGDPLLCHAGVQQDEPLSPLLFCAGIAPAIMSNGDSNLDVSQQWYLDDGLLFGEAENVARRLSTIEANLKTAHLEFNPRKCEMYSFDPDAIPAGLRRFTCERNPNEWS